MLGEALSVGNVLLAVLIVLIGALIHDSQAYRKETREALHKLREQLNHVVTDVAVLRERMRWKAPFDNQHDS